MLSDWPRRLSRKGRRSRWLIHNSFKLALRYFGNDRQTDRQTDRQIRKHTHRKKDTHTGRQTVLQTDPQKQFSPWRLQGMINRGAVTDRKNIQRIFIHQLIVGLVPAVKMDSQQGSLEVCYCCRADEGGFAQIHCFKFGSNFKIVFTPLLLSNER